MKKRIEKFNYQIEKNKETSNKLSPVDVNIHTDSFNKNRQSINLMSDELLSFLGTNLQYNFGNLSDIEISSIRPVCYFHSTPAFNLENLIDNNYFTSGIRSYWTVENNDKIINIYIYAYAYDEIESSFTTIPIYATVNIIIQNQHVWDTLQRAKK